MLYMRNKQTGEVTTVEPDSVEFATMRAQVGPDGRTSLWEQTSQAHAAAVIDRADAGELVPEDLGFEHASDLGTAALAAPPADPAPWAALTPAEVEMGLTAEKKKEEMADMFVVSPDEANAVLTAAADTISAGSDVAAEDPTEPVSSPTPGAGGTVAQAEAAAKAEEEPPDPKEQKAKAKEAAAAAKGGDS